MNIIKRPYKVLSDYLPVYDFLSANYTLYELNSMMLPQFFEYAHTHPAFNHRYTHRMTVWENDVGIVAFCGYEMDIGEAYLICNNDYSFLLSEMLSQAETLLSLQKDGYHSLTVSVIETQQKHITLLKANGYHLEYTEPIRTYQYENGFSNLTLPNGFICRSLSNSLDYQKLNRCIWRGFNHGNPVKYDIDAQMHMMNGPHYNFSLGRIIVAPDGEYACFLGMWMDKHHDYAYLEPLCTQPEYRKMGLAKYALTDAMKQTNNMGARYCFGGVPEFYTAIGFKLLCNRQFWKKEW